MTEHTIAAPTAVLASADSVTLPALSTELTKDVASPTSPSASKRDPHILPTFSRSQSPILYLPPLLSSLPEGIKHPGYPLSPPLPPSTPGAPKPLSTTARLPTIDRASLALHRALHGFRPVTDEYATVPYAEAFNWDEMLLPEEDEREWYCVAFRSKRKEGSDGGRTSVSPRIRGAYTDNLPQRCTTPTRRRTRRPSRTEG